MNSEIAKRNDSDFRRTTTKFATGTSEMIDNDNRLSKSKSKFNIKSGLM